ncbi:hypothetical protein F4553_007130 [Allocatelliglobosispora scoriae]|uniref:Uncharacterized protein n=1 Tax=Allocatelliglobosispora scoriae TaxID=643052 RepID=A0A841C1F3_9ACTN|nr:transcriptional regulator [Allocatelliglobosispora scoriae]MBB5873696.1 hypothetical protein [Allocatelliglobosispora scoriae]
MTHPSTAELLVLHAVRVKGFTDTAAVARRFDLDPAMTHEELLDAQARGWVTRSAFADLEGWSLTEAGRRRNETQLREELDTAGARADISAAHEEFLPLNTRAVRLFTAWQLAPGTAPLGGGTDRAELHRRLAAIARELEHLERRLTARLLRFTGYHDRFARALARAAADPIWITNVEVDSGHGVWFELHEDLTATLGIPR